MILVFIIKEHPMVPVMCNREFLFQYYLCYLSFGFYYLFLLLLLFMHIYCLFYRY